MSTDQRRLAVAAVILVGLTWWLATAPQSPIAPHPRHDRPVLRALASVAAVAARLGLTLMFFPVPHMSSEPAISHAAVGSDGHQLLRNERW